jgi:hypothetical protein
MIMNCKENASLAIQLIFMVLKFSHFTVYICVPLLKITDKFILYQNPAVKNEFLYFFLKDLK